MALHKIAYYAHGWHLAAKGEPLISQEFEAWRDGPVQRLVWDCFRDAGRRTISGRATRFDLVTQRASVVPPDLSPADLQLVDAIVAGYGPIHAFELSEITHEKGGPWDQVYNAPNGRITLGMRISHGLIQHHFVSRPPRRQDTA